MPSKIRVLNEQTINKIAAGEVIENPSSVIKELVENSLDANATDICIEIKGGGRQLIRVTDNGCGMNPDDAVLCLERHATSKIKNLEDVYELSTMGFRGEAIPSIASISKFTLLTCQPGDELGTMVLVDGGRIIKCCPAARAPGTTIEVKSLFFNVPVRKKFQKSPTYDSNEIMKMMTLLALGNPDIKFQLISDQKTMLSTHASIAGEKLGQRIADILGHDFLGSTCRIEGNKGEYQLHGYAGLPSYNRHNRTGQYLFINNRAVVSPLIAYAVREGYGTTLPTHRHPIFVLHLQMPGNFVDVNVHPQKREVKLRQEYAIKEFVLKAIEKGLQEAGIAFSNLFTPCPFELQEPIANVVPAFEWKPENIQKNPSPSPSWQLASGTFANERSKDQHPIPKTTCEDKQLFTHKEKPVIPAVLSAIKGYLLLDSSAIPSSKEGICLLDQRSAHSRIIFERLMQQQENAQQIPVQHLLIPHTFDLSHAEAAILRDCLENLNLAGIHIQEFGPNSFIIDAIPEVFGNVDLQGLILNFVHDLRNFQDIQGLKRQKDQQIALAASRAALSRDKKLSMQEAQALVNQLMVCQFPYQCPQGKPTMVPLSSEDLAKLFK